MSTSFQPPIIEAVVDINCDLPPGFDLPEILPASREAFRDTYPKFRSKLHLHTELRDAGDSPEITKSERSIDAIQFYSDDDKQLCQLRKNGYSFNRLAPYTQFSDYQPEILRTWGLYKGIANPLTIKQVQMRYINRIRIPCNEDPVKLDKYFTTIPELPIEMGLQQHECFLRHVTSDPKTGELVVLAFAVEAPQNDTYSILLDINVISNNEIEPDDQETLCACLSSLQDLKNRIFNLSITQSCRQLLSNPAS